MSLLWLRGGVSPSPGLSTVSHKLALDILGCSLCWCLSVFRCCCFNFLLKLKSFDLLSSDLIHFGAHPKKVLEGLHFIIGSNYINTAGLTFMVCFSNAVKQIGCIFQASVGGRWAGNLSVCENPFSRLRLPKRASPTNEFSEVLIKRPSTPPGFIFFGRDVTFAASTCQLHCAPGAEDH